MSLPVAELLTVADLAAALRLKPATVRRMVARGEIGYHRLNGKDLRFTRADLEGLLRRTRIEPPTLGKEGARV